MCTFFSFGKIKIVFDELLIIIHVYKVFASSIQVDLKDNTCVTVGLRTECIIIFTPTTKYQNMAEFSDNLRNLLLKRDTIDDKNVEEQLFFGLNESTINYHLLCANRNTNSDDSSDSQSKSSKSVFKTKFSFKQFRGLSEDSPSIDSDRDPIDVFIATVRHPKKHLTKKGYTYAIVVALVLVLLLVCGVAALMGWYFSTDQVSIMCLFYRIYIS